jgi:hypothetical protein
VLSPAPTLHTLSTIAGVTVTLRKLSREETLRSFTRRGQTDVSEYLAGLRALQVGDSAEIALDGLSSRAVKRRLGLAATQVGYRLKWAQARVNGDDRLYFRVLPATAGSIGRAGRRTRPPVAQPEAPMPETSNHAVATSSPAPTRARRQRVAKTS